MPRTNLDIYARLHGAEGKIENLEDKLHRLENRAKTTGTSLKGLWKQVAAGIGLTVGIPALARGASKLAASFLDVSVQTENYEVRLKALLGSQEAATEAMAFFEETAAKVPFTLQDIIEAGTTVTAFGADLKKWTPILTDLAAVMGMNVTDAANALGRAFAGGAGAADIFRERGILQIIKDSAKLKEGIDDITKLSLPEFRDAMFDAFTDPEGKIEGAADELSTTWSGMVSMLQDAWFKFRKAIMDAGVFEMLKDGLESLLEVVQQFEAEGGFQDVSLHVSALGEAVSKFVGWQKQQLDNVKNFIKLNKDMIKGLKGEAEETDTLESATAKLHAALVRLHETRGKELLALQEKKPVYEEILAQTELEHKTLEQLFTTYDQWGEKINWLKELRKEAGEVEQQVFMELLPPAKNYFALLMLAKDIWGDYQETVAFSSKKIIEHSESQEQAIWQVAYAAEQGIGGIIQLLKREAIGHAVKWIMSHIPFPASLIASAVAVTSISALFGHIANLQKGGIAMGETIAEIGHGRGEAIIPLERLPQIVKEISTETTITKMREMQLHQSIQIGTERVADEVVTIIQDRAERGTFVLPLKVIQ